MNATFKPLVSIGVPVFNESRFLTQSLIALTSQDYDNIEIIISDNGSDDDTKTICEEFSSKYPHISYNRFEKNLGITANASYVLDNSSGKYFMWASGHDLWDKNYISECVNQLELNQNSVLAYGRSNWIDAKNLELPRQVACKDTRDSKPISRYIAIFWGNMHPILGVINLEALRSHSIKNIPGADMVILCRLALEGAFIHTTTTSWSRREFRNESSYKDKLTRYKSEAFKISNTFIDKKFPLFKLPLELFKDVLSSKHNVFIKSTLLILLFFMLPAKFIVGISASK